MKKAIIITALVWVLTGRSAAGNTVVTAIMGDGMKSCGAWTEDRATPNRHSSEFNWVLGFITRNNWDNPDKQALFVDPAAVEAYVDNYCALNPLSSILNAAAEAVRAGGGPEPTPGSASQTP